MFVLGKQSRDRLKGVHPDLVKVVERAIQLTPQDFSVLCGVRTMDEQRALYAIGRTKPGQKVTWTLNSRHLPGPDGWGRAVDLVPFPLDWNTKAKFAVIAAAMFAAADERNISLRWGADWDRDGIEGEEGENDLPHFELVTKVVT